MALSTYLGKNPAQEGLSFEYAQGEAKAARQQTNKAIARIEPEFGQQLSESFKLHNTGKSPLFVRISATGTPLAGQEKARSTNLGMQVSYTTLDGRRLDPSRLSQGTDFLAVVTLTNPGSLGYYTDLALHQVFPSGWEIQNSRLFGSELGNYDQPDYQDIRDDRIYSFFNLYSGRSKSFAVKLTAAYPGRYYLPALSCSAMYRGDVSAVTEGMWVVVE
jgi:uncharacterized protein YfaS (alpha-2-macroglobulin family)